jgi:hypothetical protein
MDQETAWRSGFSRRAFKLHPRRTEPCGTGFTRIRATLTREKMTFIREKAPLSREKVALPRDRAALSRNKKTFFRKRIALIREKMAFIPPISLQNNVKSPVTY